jgi:hypothetical protein
MSSTTTLAYGMTDMAPAGDRAAGTVSLPEHRGGCGRQHTVTLDEDDRPVISCPACAPALIGGHHGWAASPAGVPLTPDEIGEREVAERDGVAMQRIMTKSLTDHWVSETLARKAAPATAVELFGHLSKDERAEFARLLAGAAADDSAGDDVPPRRGPGRPRKTV